MFPISDDFPCLQLQDLEELANAPLYPVPVIVASADLGPEPRVSCCFPVWFNQLSEFADYIDPVLPRRFENA